MARQPQWWFNAGPTSGANDEYKSDLNGLQNESYSWCNSIFWTFSTKYMVSLDSDKTWLYTASGMLCLLTSLECRCCQLWDINR